MRIGIAAQRCGRGVRVEAVRGRGHGCAATQVDPDPRVCRNVAEPLRAVTETGNDDIPVRHRMVNDLQDHISLEPGGASYVFEHQQPGPHHEAKPGPKKPDRRPDEPSDP